MKSNPPPEIFSGWKDIAKYLGMGVRTVQRYERSFGLPIRRIGGKSRGAVISTKSELDAWIGAVPVQRELIPRTSPATRSNTLGAEFLQIDSEIALTFSALALQTADPSKKLRTSKTARIAYDTIVRLRKIVVLNEAQGTKLNTNLERLKSDLQMLGQSF
jgi:hypothetical protein